MATAAKTNKLIESFKAARRVSTPLLGIETPDAAATTYTLVEHIAAKHPVLAWDVVRGLVGLTDAGKKAFASLGVTQDDTVPPVAMLFLLERLPADAVVFMHNAHLHLTDTRVKQAVWNLRDVFKTNGRMLVMFAPVFLLPPEVAGDVIVLSEPLPTREELGGIVERQYINGGIDVGLLTPEIKAKALDALVGLPYFTAEQVSAISLEKTGINVGKCWDRKIKAIENNQGMKVWTPRAGDTTLDELRGIDNVVTFMRELIAADVFRAIVFIDEMDKAMAGGMSDHVGDSGVSKDQIGVLLSHIENTGGMGVMLAGVAGTGKTQLAKAISVESGRPLIMFDLGGMKAGVVGESERLIRTNLKVVDATAEGRVLYIGTANKTAMFTPEMNRRFPDQFFYDFPDDAGRAAIWPVYIAKNHLTKDQVDYEPGVTDVNWTGAEIKRACDRAALLGKTVVEASQFIVSTAVSGRAQIEQLRRDADGRFLSASYPGMFEYRPLTTQAPVAMGTRKLTVQ